MPGKFHLKMYDSEPTACMMLSYDNKLHMCNVAVKQPAGFIAIKLHMSIICARLCCMLFCSHLKYAVVCW